VRKIFTEVDSIVDEPYRGAGAAALRNGGSAFFRHHPKIDASLLVRSWAVGVVIASANDHFRYETALRQVGQNALGSRKRTY
jgi:hypothetical protein